MSWVLLLSLVTESPFVQHYLSDPNGRVPVLPAWGRPRLAGGWLPPPRHPSEAFIRNALMGTGRVPGDVIVSHRLEREQLSPPRMIPGVGRARIWTLTYRCEFFGPDGPYTIYTDRTALVHAP